MDIISLPAESDRDKIDGRYRLVIAVSKRARDMYQGGKPSIETKSKKVTTIALEEVISSNLNVLTCEEAVKAKAEAGKLTYEEMMDEARQKKTLQEDLSALEKDLKVYLHEKGEKEETRSIEEIFPEKG
ncbi:DNA-directed RNA polymerase subunit omega [bacterium BMS3Abin10]|nr:DNA-directed RNA polymerase subunit omega [bacterium BMS3Abin10]